jgi:beta-glucanase (GH16 family)
MGGHHHRRKGARLATLLYFDDFDEVDFDKYLTRWWYTPEDAAGCSLPSNGELQTYVNVDGPLTTVPWNAKDSILSLTATPDETYGYLSGMLNTYGKFVRRYGYFEIRAKTPPGNGMWPAFWLLPADGAWPPEIDILEWLGRDPLTRYCGTHSNFASGKDSQAGTHPIPDASADFHTYGCDWQADRISFYFDSELMSSVPTPSDMHVSMYMILNLAIGGGWAGPPDASTVFPSCLLVDYLAVYDLCPYNGHPEPPNPTTYEIPTPWAAVDLRGQFQPGDRVVLNFAYDELSILRDSSSSYVWCRVGASYTLSVMLPGSVTALG